MTLNFKPQPSSLTFKDVLPNTFYKDHQGDLMFKVDTECAVRIAGPNGSLNARIYTPALHTGVQEIYNVEKINF